MSYFLKTTILESQTYITYLLCIIHWMWVFLLETTTKHISCSWCFSIELCHVLYFCRKCLHFVCSNYFGTVYFILFIDLYMLLPLSHIYPICVYNNRRFLPLSSSFKCQLKIAFYKVYNLHEFKYLILCIMLNDVGIGYYEWSIPMFPEIIPYLIPCSDNHHIYATHSNCLTKNFWTIIWKLYLIFSRAYIGIILSFHCKLIVNMYTWSGYLPPYYSQCDR